MVWYHKIFKNDRLWVKMLKLCNTPIRVLLIQCLSFPSFAIWTSWLRVPYECSSCFYCFLHMFVAHGHCMVIVAPMHAASLICAIIIHKLFTPQCHMTFCLTLQQWQVFSHWNSCFVSHNFKHSYNTMDVVFDISNYNGFKQEMQWKDNCKLEFMQCFYKQASPTILSWNFMFHSI